MPTIGEKLRSARMELALTLDEIAVATRIDLKYLRAMEADDRSEFPAAFFYRSFVLQYAKQIDLNDVEITADLDVILSAEAPLPLPGQESEPSRRGILPISSPHSGWFFADRKLLTSLASLVLAIAGCTGLYAWWESLRHPARPSSTTRSQPSDNLPTVQKERVPDRAKPLIPSPLQAQAQPTSEPEGNSDAEVPANSKLSLNLAATEATWLSVSSDGKTVFSGILRANQSKALGAIERAKLVVGNAGGLSVEWNGRQIGPLGKRGQVRVVTFTHDGYKFLDSADKTGPLAERAAD